MLDASGLYEINTKDVFTYFGFVVSAGRADFEKDRTPKDRFKNSWPEENGDEYDLTEVMKFEDRDITLKGNIYGSDYADFKAKKDLLFAEFRRPGTSALRCIAVDETINVIYLGSTPITPLPTTDGGVAGYIEMSLREVQQS